jgi:hypothetical protein
MGVHIPSRHDIMEALRRLSQRIYVATADIRVRLEQVPTAYRDNRYHTLYLGWTTTFDGAS